MKIVFLILFSAFEVLLGDTSPKEVRCLVCKTTIEEMTREIDKVNPNKKIQVGGYRIDKNGELDQKLVSFARSGMHLSELMETVCKSMEEYVRARSKETGELLLIKLMTSEGTMNPKISEVDIIQDSDLNKSLEFYCEGIVEEFEDEIYNELKEPSEDPVNSICKKVTNICNYEKVEL